MATYDVVKVRKESAADGHRHIIGVIVAGGAYSTNRTVVDSIKAGNTWQTSVAGEPKAKIKESNSCTRSGCSHKPYLTTAPDHSTKNNLENLPEG